MVVISTAASLDKFWVKSLIISKNSTVFYSILQPIKDLSKIMTESYKPRKGGVEVGRRDARSHMGPQYSGVV